MNASDQLPERALDWHRAGGGAVIATVVDTWGSAPRPAGSQMAVRGDGHMEGSVSGGCVEGAVVLEALEALEGGKPRLLSYGVSNEDAFSVGLACGGTIRILVEPVGPVVPEALLAQLVEARAARRPVAYVTSLEGGAPKLVERDTYEDRFRADKSGVEPDGVTFVAVHNPPLRMFVVGGVHIAQTLVPMAQACGYDVTLIDPRDAFASPARFPDTHLIADWPDEALADVGLDARCAVVTLAHDPKLDDPAITAALRSECFYVGSLGSKKTHAKRIERLSAAGFTADDLNRIRGPVGLDIGAKSPTEIAISIMAQVTEVLRKP